VQRRNWRSDTRKNEISPKESIILYMKMRSSKKIELFRYKKDTDKRRKAQSDTTKEEVSQKESMI
jgi:hypothetical protein